MTSSFHQQTYSKLYFTWRQKRRAFQCFSSNLRGWISRLTSDCSCHSYSKWRHVRSRRYIVQTIIFGIYVSFRGCNFLKKKNITFGGFAPANICQQSDAGPGLTWQYIDPTCRVFKQMHRLTTLQVPRSIFGQYFHRFKTGWWLNRPIWKILVKMGIFPK